MKIPFAPAVYEHAARFVNRSPWDVSRDADLLFEGHSGAYREYRHSTVAVGIDIYNLEAEAYGGVIEKPPGNNIPAIHTPPLAALEDGLNIAPYDCARDGRIAMVIDVGRRLKQRFPEADVRIPVAGPFSIAFNLLGITSLCEEAALRPEMVARFLMRLAENQAGLCRAVKAAGLDIAFFESAASPPMLSPAGFHEVELPALKRILHIAADCVGHGVPCIMGGNTYPILQDILSTGTSFLVCNVETNQKAFVDDVCRTHPQVKIRVNLDPGVVAGSDLSKIYKGVDRILEIVAGRSNCMMGTGALPYETPIENVRRIREYIS